jgi:hypothetical protein
MERNSLDVIEVLYRHFPGGTEKSYTILNLDSRSSGRDSNRASSQHKSKAFPIESA